MFYSWCVTNKLSLNLLKTCVVPSNLKTFVNLPDIKFNDKTICCVRNIKFLDIFIDYALSWNIHTNFVCNKLSQCYAMLNACIHLLPLKLGIQIYYVYDYPYILYGAESWGNTFAIHSSPIVLQQKKIIRLLFKLSTHSHCAPFTSLAKILYLPDIVIIIIISL